MEGIYLSLELSASCTGELVCITTREIREGGEEYRESALIVVVVGGGGGGDGRMMMLPGWRS